MPPPKNSGEPSKIPGRIRPQYNYFYGSTTETGADALTSSINDTDSLIGEVLVATDNEEEAPTSTEHDLQHRMIANHHSPPYRFSLLACCRKRPLGNGLGRVILILFAASSISTFFILQIPHSSRLIPETQDIFIPFERVNRADYGDPVEGFINMELFHPSLISDDSQRAFNFPFPTGAWWTNLVVPSSDSVYSYPIVVYPYAYKWSDSSLQISYPASHRVEDESHSWIADTFEPQLTMTTVESSIARFITKFDPLSVTMRFVSKVAGKWEVTLVQGTPYTTIKYLNSTPNIKALSTFKSVQCPGDEAEDFHDFIDDGADDDDGQRRLFGVCSTEDDGKNTYMRGVQFMFTSEEGAYWIMFSSEPIALIYDNIRKTTITATSPFTGVVRIAYIPVENSADTPTSSSTGLRRLIYHAGVYPTGCDVTWDFHSQNQPTNKVKQVNGTSTSRHATVHFTFGTNTMTEDSVRNTNSETGLLMLALPHHTQNLPKSILLNQKHFNLTYHCIKGPLTPTVGSVWSLEEPLLVLDFDTPGQKIDSGVRRAILNQVDSDMSRVLPSNNENVYGYGKQVARLAQLVHIASVLGPDEDNQKSKGSTDQISTLERGKTLLFSCLENFLTAQVADFLLFDANLGGLVSKDGILDKNADFGNGRYNDHHFHYGYFLYASSIMARLDPSFLAQFGSHIDTVFHDVAHPTNGDSKTALPSSIFFPMSRHKSWYDGHSFATGMFPFGDGKSQESSSESVNCYYGAYLWSLVRHANGSASSDLTDFARLLFATEIRGAQTYWHMIPKSALGRKSEVSHVYSPAFQENYMVGNVGMLDVAANTWFGNDPLYVHMINAIPITSATAILFDRPYVEHEYKYLKDSLGEIEMAWRGYTVSIHAIIDPNKAWEEAQELVSYELDAAISKSQVLYWISCRPGFNVTVQFGDEGLNPGQENPSWNHADNGDGPPMDSACTVHLQCKEANLTGYCCPTTSGVILGCCT